MSEKSLDTLVQDIYGVFDGKVVVSEKDADAFGRAVSRIISERIGERGEAPYLRLSNLGTKCDRKLWYTLRTPEVAEPLEPHTRLKFLIGDLWEAVLLFLAKVAGHKVEGEQDEVSVHGVKGHRDAVIDGTIVDVKSASTFAFDKFKAGLTPEKDDFGYLTQIDAYLETAQTDPLVQNKDEAAFLVGDKVLGHLTVDKHPRQGVNYEELVKKKREMLEQPTPPPRGFSDVPDGKSGNRKLGTYCSYCQFKETCWPGLKTYAYAGKPRHLTKVVREPKVPLSDGEGPF